MGLAWQGTPAGCGAYKGYGHGLGLGHGTWSSDGGGKRSGFVHFNASDGGIDVSVSVGVRD